MKIGKAQNVKFHWFPKRITLKGNLPKYYNWLGYNFSFTEEVRKCKNCRKKYLGTINQCAIQNPGITGNEYKRQIFGYGGPPHLESIKEQYFQSLIKPFKMDFTVKKNNFQRIEWLKKNCNCFYTSPKRKMYLNKEINKNDDCPFYKSIPKWIRCRLTLEIFRLFCS